MQRDIRGLTEEGVPRRGFAEEAMFERGAKPFLAERTAGAEAWRPRRGRCLPRLDADQRESPFPGEELPDFWGGKEVVSKPWEV